MGRRLGYRSLITDLLYIVHIREYSPDFGKWFTEVSKTMVRCIISLNLKNFDNAFFLMIL